MSPQPFQLFSPGAETSERCKTAIEIWISAGTPGERDKGASSVLEMKVGTKKQVYLSGKNQISTGKPATSLSCQEGHVRVLLKTACVLGIIFLPVFSWPLCVKEHMFCFNVCGPSGSPSRGILPTPVLSYPWFVLRLLTSSHPDPFFWDTKDSSRKSLGEKKWIRIFTPVHLRT